MGQHGRFSLAIPVAASSHEYEHYRPGSACCGPACIPYDSHVRQVDYVRAALDLLDQDPFFQATNRQYVGLSLWTFANGVSFPAGTRNSWHPSKPSEATLALLKSRL